MQREHRPRQPEAGTRVFWESARAVLPRICVSLAIGIAQKERPHAALWTCPGLRDTGFVC